MKVGITASSQHVTAAQVDRFARLLKELGATEMHHGDCVEGDAKGHAVARALGLRVVLHPPTNASHRAFCEPDESRAPRPYLDRNKDIVDETEVLVAMPNTIAERLRSGTWSTVRYAQKRGRIVYIILPDGSVVREPGRAAR